METPVRENDFIEDIGAVIGYVEAFAESKVQLAKLEVAEKVAMTTASLTTGIILLTLVPVFLCVLSAALGFSLVESFGWSFANSFFALSGFYLVLGVLLVRFRGVLFTEPILETVIKQIFAK